jgi:hypothetical protein
MLHTETVEPGTLSLLKQLQSIPALEDFHLVGRTALSLKYGHRTSIDLDLFNHKGFDNEAVLTKLEEEFGNALSFRNRGTNFGIFCFINNIKVDLVRFAINPIKEIEIHEGIKMYSSEDIAAMKIQAILGRGKKKDFWDIYELLKWFSLNDIIKFHEEKFPSQMLAIGIPHALTFFLEAEDSEEPFSLKGQTWEKVKNGINKKVRDYLI